jgi:hypothetical protein
MQSTLSAIIIIFIIFISSILTSCQQQTTKSPTVVSTQIPTNTKAPKIVAIKDLGGLDITHGNTIPSYFSDNRFSPGEWIMLQGSNLGAAKIDIDGIAVTTMAYFDNNPLLQIPTQLSPLKKHRLTLQTELGTATTDFYTSHYITATDTDGKAIHLIRTNPEAKGGVEEEWVQLEGGLDRPMFALISVDSRYLFAINIKNEINRIYPDLNAYRLDIITYHLAHPNQPKIINSWTVDIGSSPIDATLNSQGNLLLLGKRSFTLVDVSNPTKPQLIGSKLLPTTQERATYVDAIFLNKNQQMAFLETYSNSVYLFDTDPSKQFPLLSKLALLPSKTIPLSVDLEVDNKNDSEFWVLQGPNYRLNVDATKKLYDTIFRKDKHDANKEYLSQIQKISVVSSSMIMKKTFSLPEKYVAFFAKFGHHNQMYITMTKLDFLNAQTDAENLPTKTLLKKMSSFLWDSISIGRVISLDADTGRYDTVANGVGIYYDIVDVPDIGPVFSLLKLGPSFSFPFIAPTWGVGIKSTGTYTKRKMSGTAIFPPYSVGFVDYQE